MPTATTRTLAAVLAAACTSAAAVVALAPASDAVPVSPQPVRIVGVAEGKLNGGAALAADGTVVQRVEPSLRIYPPGARGGDPPATVITGLASQAGTVPSLDPVRGIATVAGRGDDARVVVVDPDQASGAVVPVRSLAGANTTIGLPLAVTWAADGSLWVVDVDADFGPGVELLRFGPTADGDVAPDQVIGGPATGLNGLAAAAVDVLPDGSVVVGGFATNRDVLVFRAGQRGNVAPARRFLPVAPGPSYVQTGLAADSRGRVLVAMGDLDGKDWGVVAVYPAGATGNADPVLEVTGAASGLHIVGHPSLSPDDRLMVTDLTRVTGEVRLLEFTPLPQAPSAARALRAKLKGTKVRFRWRKPANTGHATISRYLVKVTKGKRTLVRASLPGSKRKYVVARSRLPRGRVTVTVTAVNVAGRGAEAVKKFRRLGTGPGS